MSNNSDAPKPTASAHSDGVYMEIPMEKLAEYFTSMIDEDAAEAIVKQLCAQGKVVDEVACTLIAALASFLATCYADNEQRACATWGHLNVYGHAVMHTMITEIDESALEAAEEKDAQDLSDS